MESVSTSEALFRLVIQHNVDRHHVQENAEAKDGHDAPPGEREPPLLATDLSATACLTPHVFGPLSVAGITGLT